MSHLCVFFNTRVENSGTLASIGDTCFAPIRYWCNGKTICLIEYLNIKAIYIHHVASFHSEGEKNCCAGWPTLKSSPTGMIKTILSIVCIVPGFFVGLVL